MTKKVITALCCLLALFHAFIPVSPVSAKNQAEITDVDVHSDQGDLQVTFRVEDCFTPKMEQAILSGVPTTFRMRVVLEKAERPLLRPPIVEIMVEHTLKYDFLKKEFRVQLPEHPDRVCYTRDFDEAKQLMSGVRDLPVIPIRRLEKAASYQVWMKAELSTVKLPLFLRYILFFVSLWDFESNWRQAPFSP